ncbi:MAG: magnesium transporter [Epsilonproteobacteria bacterium]|jgi:magnesium transporter|nr:magnesium transporter [Campylobacterota bacterium]NPA89213.1 magnesium transporter CorA family protein [Campylobacterota bacterium]
MYLFGKGVKRVEDVEITPGRKEIIFTTTHNQSVLKWLRENGFHESFIEDITSEEQTITFEREENFDLVIFKYIGFDEEEKLLYQELNIVAIVTQSKFFLLARDKEVIVELARKFEKRYRKDYNFEYVLYLIADILVDTTILVVDVIDETLEDIEDAIFKKRIKEEELQKDIYYTRRTLNRISKISIHHKEIVRRLYNSFSEEIKKQLKYEFIDLEEHLKYLIDEAKTLLDRTGYLLNLYMGLISTTMNRAMQRLAAISIIFMPITYLAGLYGMNFDQMPLIHSPWGFWIMVAFNIVVVMVSLILLRKMKFL